uniref:Histone H3.3 n=1 Tax=Crypthecodinium cohnii TaxID=2866 RepID=A0A8K1XV50_CRYCO|nr:histone H3.3 [Crypthecodinium cohnii]
MARTMAEVKSQESPAFKKGKKDKKKTITTTTQGSTIPTSTPGATSSEAPPRTYAPTTDLHFPKSSFQKVVREISRKLRPVRFEAQGLLALQEASEAFLCGLYEDAASLALHGRRKTVRIRDLQLSQRLRGVHGHCRVEVNSLGWPS